MGHLSAQDFAAHSPSLEATLTWHFQSNCYPPVPSLMIRPAIEAIRAVASGEARKLIDLPKGVKYKTGATEVTACTLVDSLRLDAFVTDQMEREERY